MVTHRNVSRPAFQVLGRKTWISGAGVSGKPARPKGFSNN